MQQTSETAEAKKSTSQKNKEKRKMEREERKSKIEELEARKPDQKISEKDLEEIENAAKTMGDYKLKSSDDYEVPKHERVNASQKKHQMLLLESSLYSMKSEFNKKVVEMRQKKKSLIEKITNQNERLGEINKTLKLDPKMDIFQPTIDGDLEEPEKSLEITDKDVKNFAKEKRRKEQELLKKKHKKIEEVQEQEESDSDQEETGIKKEIESAHLEGIPNRKGKKEQKSQLEVELVKMREIELRYEKNTILYSIKKDIKKFDEEIQTLQKEKFKLESDLKNADMKLIIHYDELLMLEGLEERDNKLTDRLLKSKMEKTVVLKELNEISKKLKDKDKEIEHIKDEIDACFKKFHELISLEMPEYKELYEFFTKRIRRKKQKEEEIENSDDEGEKEEEEESEEDEDDEDLIDEEEDNQMAMKFNQEDHKIDDIEKYRTEKLDWEDKLKKTEKSTSSLNRDRENCNEREERINAELQRIENEITLFHKDKMRRLNRLDISFVLRCDQIQNLEKDDTQLEKWAEIKASKKKEMLEKDEGDRESLKEKDSIQEHSRVQNSEVGDTINTALVERDDRGHYLPRDLNRSILFTKQQIQDLLNTKRKLRQECDEQYISKNKITEKIEKKRKEITEKKIKETKAQKKFDEQLLLKFGNLIDLDHLVTWGQSEHLQKKQQKFNMIEKECVKKMRVAEETLERTKRELSDEIKKNTELLNHITTLGEKRNRLQAKLESTNQRIFDLENTDEKAKLIKEREKIKEVLELQTERIAVLKKEIELFKRKGGHIYTTITANRRVVGMGPDNQ